MEIHLAAVVTLDGLTRSDSRQGEVTEPRDVEESDIGGGNKNEKSEEFSPSCKFPTNKSDAFYPILRR